MVVWLVQALKPVAQSQEYDQYSRCCHVDEEHIHPEKVSLRPAFQNEVYLSVHMLYAQIRRVCTKHTSRLCA